ncbi:DUF7660 family protein [Saccharomonospora iraqiensis]|uniref:DUF7660 family protein n=1 Tax=Saccharomonospora iraqiensis TaxID=52698 RepID=UPI0012B5FFDD|nr:hypothetical protein [Saccharomonospora iraqiensis]
MPDRNDMEDTLNPESISSRAELSTYLASLTSMIRQGHIPAENATTEDFLEAASAWLSDMDGYSAWRGEPTPEAPTWPLVAALFRAALAYE